jgi:Tfp pilus assembly protein PilF
MMAEAKHTLMIALLLCGACKSKSSDAPAPTATASATAALSIASHATAHADTGIANSIDEKKEHALMLSATAKGRSAAAKKDWPAAIAAFDEAVKHAPRDARPLGERGYVKFLSGDPIAAEKDLEAARDLGASPKIMAQIWFNLGLVREQNGDGEGARTAFATSQSLNASKAAAAKIKGLSTCLAEVTNGDTDLQAMKDWVQAAGTVSSEDAPADEAKAKDVTCTYSWSADTSGDKHDACDGAPPWIVAHDHLSFYSHVDILFPSTTKGVQVYVADQGMNGSWPAHCTGESDSTAKMDGKFGWTTATYAGAMGVMFQPGEDTSDAVNLTDNGEFSCGDAPGSITDAFYDLSTGAELLEVRRPIAVSAKAPLSTVAFQNGVVTIGGAGCNQSVDLKAPRARDAGK